VGAALGLQGGFFFAMSTRMKNYSAVRSTTVKNNVPVDDKLFDKPKADPKK
jgi:hypothetical protein